MYIITLATRLIARYRIIYFPIGAVAIGIMFIIVVNSVMNGFSRDIRSRIRGMQSHLTARGIFNDLMMYDWQEIVPKVKEIPGVKGAAPRVSYQFMEMRYRRMMTVIGIDPKQELTTGDLAQYFQQGGSQFDFADPEADVLGTIPCVVGSEIGLSVGSVIELRTFRDRGQLDMKSISVGSFHVIGKFNSKMIEYDSTYIFCPLDRLQKLLNLGPDRATSIAVNLENYELDAPRVAKEIDRVIKQSGNRGIVIRTWEEEKETLLSAVNIERNIQVVILLSIILVAGFNIIAIYTLMVKAKTRDIGVLMALGATRGGVSTIFLLSGTLCGLLGCLLGVGLGILLSLNLDGIVKFIEKSSIELNRFALMNPDAFVVKSVYVVGGAVLLGVIAVGAALRLLKFRKTFVVYAVVAFILLLAAFPFYHILVSPRPAYWVGYNLFPKDIYYLENIPVEINYFTVVFVSVVSLVVSMVFSIYPARVAAKQDPVEAIRYE